MNDQTYKQTYILMIHVFTLCASLTKHIACIQQYLITHKGAI